MRETETDFASRLKKAHNQVGNVFPEKELKNIFINGLSQGVRPMVTEFGKSDMALLEIEGLASSLGEAFRNQLRTEVGRTTAKPARKPEPVALVSPSNTENSSLAGSYSASLPQTGDSTRDGTPLLAFDRSSERPPPSRGPMQVTSPSSMHPPSRGWESVSNASLAPPGEYSPHPYPLPPSAPWYQFHHPRAPMGDYWPQTLPPPGNYGSWTQPMGYGPPQKDSNPPATDRIAASTPYRSPQSPKKPVKLCDFCRAPGHFFRSCPHLGNLPEAVRTQVINLRMAATSQNRGPRAIPRPTCPGRTASHY